MYCSLCELYNQWQGNATCATIVHVECVMELS